MKLRITIAALAALLSAVPASAATIEFRATLLGETENPPVVSTGTGFALLTYDDVAHTLDVEVEFEDLVGTTTDAHIHCCVDPPGTVGVAVGFASTGFPLGVTSGTYQNVFDLTLDATYTAGFRTTFGGGTAAGAEAALIAAFMSGRAYVNIHSSFVGSGEIRGFVTAVPEPATVTLLGIAGLALLRARRRPSRA